MADEFTDLVPATRRGTDDDPFADLIPGRSSAAIDPFADLIPSRGVGSNGMLPGHAGTLDASKAGDNWATFELSEEGIPKHYVLPTQPNDRPADDATGFLGDAVERFQKTKQHFGAFDTDEAGERFMNSAALTKPQSVDKAAQTPTDTWAQIAIKAAKRIWPNIEAGLAGLVRQFEENPVMMEGGYAEEDIRQRAKEEITKHPELSEGKKLYDAAQQDLKDNAYNVGDSTLKKYAGMIADSVPAMATAFAVGLVTRGAGAAPALASGLGIGSLSAQVAGQQYGESREMGRNPGAASIDGAVMGAFDALGENIPLGILFKEGGKFLGRVFKTAGAEGLQEIGTQILQSGYDAGVLHPDMTWGQAIEQVRDAGIVGAVTGGAIAAGTHPFVREEAGTEQQFAPPTPQTGQPSTPSTAPSRPTKTAADYLTPDDIASPLPNDLIAKGKKIIADTLKAKGADDILKHNGWPTTGSKVSVEQNGVTRAGEVVDAFSAELPGLGIADDGIKLRMDDGTTFEAFKRDLAASGAKIQHALAAPTEAVQPGVGPEAPTTALAAEPQPARAAASPKGDIPELVSPKLDLGEFADLVPSKPVGKVNTPLTIGDGTRGAPMKVSEPEHLASVRDRVNTEATDEQKKAGNYEKAHIEVHGLPISIETPKGSERTGISPTGEKWSVTMPADYGYIKRTEGADDEHFDVYVGPDPRSTRVFVIDQVDAESGEFDEHKGMLGFPDKESALKTYAAGFSDGKGPDRIGGVVEMSVEQFNNYLETADLKKPASKEVGKEREPSGPAGGKTERAPVEVSPTTTATSVAQRQLEGESISATWSRNMAALYPENQPPSQKAIDRAAAQIVRAIATGEYSDHFRPDNRASRRTFEELTGTKLPPSISKTKDFLNAGAPFTVKDVGAKPAPAEEPSKAKGEGKADELAGRPAKTDKQPPAPDRTLEEGDRRHKDLMRRAEKFETVHDADLRVGKRNFAKIKVFSDPETGKFYNETHYELGGFSGGGGGAYTPHDTAQGALDEAKADLLRSLSDTARAPDSVVEAAGKLKRQVEAQTVTSKPPLERQLEKPEITPEETPDERPSRDVSRPPEEAPEQVSARPERDRTEQPGGEPERVDRGRSEPPTEPGQAKAEGVDRGGDKAAAERADTGRERSDENVPAGGREGSRANRSVGRVRGSNYRIRDLGKLTDGGAKTHAKNNIAAIKVLRELQRSGELATPEQQDALATYVGWGGIPQIFDEKNKDYAALRTELQDLLSEDEYKAARASTINAHYTSQPVIEAIWSGLRAMGFTGGTVLEPGMGVGNFLGLVPDELSETTKFTGVELDPITGGIARALYPKANVFVQGFEATALAENSFDAIVGNVPFANFNPADKVYNKKRTLSLHNYFIVKGLHLLKPGGVMAVVTSRYSMDAVDSTARQAMAAAGGDLVGAVRLPDTAFKENAGTEVVTDILIFRKRKEGEEPSSAYAPSDFVGTEKIKVGDKPVPINVYFARHPDQVLGTHSLEGNMFAGESYTVKPTGNLGGLLPPAIKRITQSARSRGLEFAAGTNAQTNPTGEQQFDDALPPENVKDGAYFVDNGNIRQRTGVTSIAAKFPKLEVPRIKALIELRDTAREVLSSQRAFWDGTGVAPWKEAQRQLNQRYDAFVAKYGPVNKVVITERTLPSGEVRQYRRYPNIQAFKDDPDWHLVSAVERYDEESGKASKASIMSERVIEPHKEIVRVETSDEALLASMNVHAGVNLPYMAELVGKPESQVRTDLAGRIFRDPASGGWQLSERYLSGDVREKLKAAREAGSAYAPNVKALEAIQPVDLKPEEISVLLGAPWVPSDDVSEFVSGLIDTPSRVRHLPTEAMWIVKPSNPGTVANTRTWGTARLSAHEIMSQALNGSETVVYDTDKDGKRTLNQQETVAAKEKRSQIEAEFQSWIFREPKRSERLARLYNDKFNNLRLPDYNGEHLTLPGSSSSIILRSTQKRAIWRFLVNGNTLLDHRVGAGKTFTAIAAGMEAKRLGILHKPAFVVPNHMLEQFSREFLQLYPGANIMVADETNFAGDRRRSFVARVAAENLDAVILTHTSFELLPTSPEYQTQFIERQIDEYESLIREAKGDRVTVKELEKAKKRREEKLKALAEAKDRDTGVTFEETGIDGLFVDEAHLFKNLEFATKNRTVSVPTSQRAFDMYLKTRLIDERSPGRGLMFMTGTPIANSMAEMYTMQRYMAARSLSERGLSHFDAWASQFGEFVTSAEITPEGKGARLKTRFAKFRNIPELVSMYRQFADFVGREDLIATGVKLPTIRTGGPQIVEVEGSDVLKTFVASLAERAEAIRHGVDPSVDNMLKITSEGRKAALDMRLVGFPEETRRKAVAAVSNAVGIWKDTAKRKLTQIIFLDLSKPTGGKGFSVYEDIRDLLVARGVPKSEIAFIHDADTTDKKAVLFREVREGKRRFLLGSTEKMGVGTNVQTKLRALHHIDVPWRPADLEQRDGRIERQGNENEEIDIFNYVTVGSFDAYQWQTLERKARFINQVKKGDAGVRVAEDIDQQAMSYAEIKAIASGNPLILEKAKVDSDVDRLSRLRNAHASAQRSIAYEIETELPSRLKSAQRAIDALQADIERTKLPGKDDFTATIQGKTYAKRAEAAEALGDLVVRAHEHAVETKQKSEITAGKFAGFDVRIAVSPFSEPSLVMVGAAEREVPLDLGSVRRGALTRLENAIERLPTQLTFQEERVAEMEKRRKDLRGEFGKAFNKTDEFAAAVKRQGEIDIALGLVQPPAAEGTAPAEEKPAFARRAKTPVFYSTLTKSIEDAKQDKAPPGQWLGIIDNLKGVKKEEVEWSGVKEWLAKQLKSVTRAELLAFLKSNEITIEEVEKGGARDTSKLFPEDPGDWEEDTEERATYDSGEPRNAVLRSGDAMVEFHFRENGDVLAVDAEWKGAQQHRFVDFIAAREWLIDQAGLGGGAGTKFSTYSLPGGQNYRELLLTLPNRTVYDVGGVGRKERADFNSGHFDEANILAHVRFDDRIQPTYTAAQIEDIGKRIAKALNAKPENLGSGAPMAAVARGAITRLEGAQYSHAKGYVGVDKDGAVSKTLHVAEVQSDWHQKGRRQGYRSGEDRAALGKELQDANAKASLLHNQYAKALDDNDRYRIGTPERAEARERRDRLSREYGQQLDVVVEIHKRIRATDGVPNAPFKQSWQELAMKRMLRYAAENGYDRLSWDTGETQADRYDLSTVLDAVTVVPTNDTVTWWPKKKGGGDVGSITTDKKGLITKANSMFDDAVGQNISDVLGKDIADKGLAATKETRFAGLDLKIGGEGMTGFYDRILPQFMAKYTKKWGGKIERGAVAVGTATSQHGREAPTHSIAITPEMREAVLQPQPLFARRAPKPNVFDQPLTRTETRAGLTSIYSPKLEAQRAELHDALREVLDEMGLQRVSINVADRLLWDKGEAMDGAYHKRLISIAMDTHNPLAILDHEAIHALYRLGLFTDAEWSVLTRAAKREWVNRYADKLSGYPEGEDRVEEAIAFAAMDHATGTALEGGGAAVRLLQRVRDFVEALGNFFRGHGFQTAGDVLNRAQSGEVGRRDAVDETGPMGLSHDFMKAGKGPAFARRKLGKDRTVSAVTFADRASEARFKKAREGIGGPQIVQRAREWWTSLKNGMTRTFIDLPESARFADVAQQLRKLKANYGAATEEIERMLTDLVGDMNAAEFDIFSRKVILDDLSWEASLDHDLPFGLDKANVATELAKVDAALARRPDLIARVRMRKLMVREIADRLVRAGVLDAASVKNPAYYRHVVLEYAQAEARTAKTAAGRLRSPYWARRLGSLKDINANILEAEFDWLRKALHDIRAADTIDWIKKSNLNIRNAVTRAARKHNDDAIASIIRDEHAAGGPFDNKGRTPTEAMMLGFKQRIAMGLQRVAAAIDDGSLVVPPRFDAAAIAISAKTPNDNVMPMLGYVLEHNLAGSMGAATAFKAIAERRAFIRDTLGENYADPANVKGLVARGLAPDGYTTWQPEPGKIFYTASTLPEHAIDRFLKKVADSGNGLGLGGGDMARLMADEITKASRDVLAVGSDKYTMVLPEELAATLDNISDPHIESLFHALVEVPLRAWKQWVLLNPLRVLKYNLNNLSGDLDAIIAGNPAIVRRVPQAIKELWSVVKKQEAPSAKYKDAVQRDVFNANFTVQEIPDITELSQFRHLFGERSVSQKVTAPIGAAWRQLRKWTTFRENIIRYAAYLDYLDRIERGDTPEQIGYGASRPEIVDAVTDNKDKAALLARELVGDYGAVSAYGRNIRRTTIPFWSWQEINLKRYWRLTSNAYRAGIGQGVTKSGAIGAVMGVRVSAYLGLRMFAIYGLIQMWNHLVHGDDEDELDPEQSRQLHILLGRSPSGEIVSLRLQGAVSDFMSWFGVGDAAGALSEVSKGRGSPLDVVKAVAKAPVNKLWSGLTPVFTIPLNMASGATYFPDMFNPIPIHDKWREVFRLFSLDPAYDAVLGKPTRGAGSAIANAIVYKRDPGEIAYDEVRGLAFNWVSRKRGESGVNAATTVRSEAMRDWRLASRYGDARAAEVAVKKMRGLGVTILDGQRSIRAANPLGPVAQRDRSAFLATLDEREKRRVREAQRWYVETYVRGAETALRAALK